MRHPNVAMVATETGVDKCCTTNLMKCLHLAPLQRILRCILHGETEVILHGDDGDKRGASCTSKT